MDFICSHCNSPLTDYKAGDTVGRSATCSSCGADLHACIQCKHYDESAYNACREPQADRVVEKARSNFCDYFTLATERTGGGKNSADTLKKLDDLFK